MTTSKIRYQTSEVHIHKICQANGMTYEAVYKKYGHLIDSRSMVKSSDINIHG